MVATRQDAWTEDDDLLLAEVTLRHIREGGTQLAAFEEVGYRLNRTAAACGFRWNSAVRKKYGSAIQIAKAQRQQLKSRGKSRFIPDQDISMGAPSTTNGYSATPYPKYEYQTEFSPEFSHTPVAPQGNQQTSGELSFDDVIRFLRQHKESFKSMKQVNKELQEKNLEIERLREENQRMKKELDSTQNDYQTMNEDYKSLMKIMERARKLAFLADEDTEEKASFKMDKNGNLERVDK